MVRLRRILHPPKGGKRWETKKKKGKKVHKDADHEPLTAGKKGNEDDDESDDLDGLEGVLDRGSDKEVKRKPGTKTKEHSKKRPAASRGSKKKDRIGCDMDVMLNHVK